VNSKKRCKHCKNYGPVGEMLKVPAGTFCSAEHATEWARQRAGALLDAKLKKSNAADKRRLKESTIRDQKSLAQTAFNQYVRAMRLSQGDEHCISCGRHHSEIEDKGFGKFDCGHFLSVGARPELRFTVENAYLQCKSCNGGSGKYAKKAETVGRQYEARLRERVGDDLVEWLKGPHEIPRWRAADYVEFKKKFRAMKKEIINANGPMVSRNDADL